MTWAIVEDGQIKRTFNGNRAITVGSVQHPESIFRLWSKDELKAIGIYEVVETGSRNNDSFYINGETTSFDSENNRVVRALTSTPRDLQGLKNNLIRSVKTSANNYLSPYDWVVIRSMENPQKAVPQNIKAFREAVRTRSNELEEAITAAVSVAELEALVITWPEQPI